MKNSAFLSLKTRETRKNLALLPTPPGGVDLADGVGRHFRRDCVGGTSSEQPYGLG